MNRQLGKMEMPHNQTTHNQTTQKKTTNTRTKGKPGKFKGNYECGKTTLPSLRNIEWRTFKTETNKINQVLRGVFNKFSDFSCTGI